MINATLSIENKRKEKWKMHFMRILTEEIEQRINHLKVAIPITYNHNLLGLKLLSKWFRKGKRKGLSKTTVYPTEIN